jgi:hypothetical protein
MKRREFIVTLAMTGYGLQNRLAPRRDFVEADQRDLGRPDLFAKIFPFTPDANHFTTLAVPPHREGRIAIVTDAGWDAVDADSAIDERH